MKAKPLEWARYERGQLCAPTRLRADYWIRPVLNRWRAGANFFMDEVVCDTEEQAIAACQSHFQAELAAMIEG